MSSVAVIWSEERTKPPGCVQNRISTPSWCDTRMMLSFIRIAPAKGGFFADLLIKPRKNAEHAESLTRTPTGQAARRHSFALNSFASAERSKGRSPTNSYASFEHRNRFLQCPNGLRLTVPPGLLILSVANPEFRSCLAALGATVCRPSGTCLNVGRYRWLARSLLPPSLPRVPLVPRCTRGNCLPSLRDSSLALLWSRSFPLQSRFLGLANSCHTMANSCHTMARLCHAMANCCHRINISVAKNLPAGPHLYTFSIISADPQPRRIPQVGQTMKCSFIIKPIQNRGKQIISMTIRTIKPAWDISDRATGCCWLPQL